MRNSYTSTSFLRQIFSKKGATHALSFNVHVNRLLGFRVYGLPNVFKKVNENSGVRDVYGDKINFNENFIKNQN